MLTEVDDELEKYAAKPASEDDELEKYAHKPGRQEQTPGSLEEYLSHPSSGRTGGGASGGEPSFFHKVGHEYPAAFMSAAGLPTSISDIPDWTYKLLGQKKGQPFTWGSPKNLGGIGEAIKHPTEENIVGAVPFIGPGSVQAAQKFRENKPGEALMSLAGTVAPFAAPKVARIAAERLPLPEDVPGKVVETARAITPSKERVGLALRRPDQTLKPGTEALARTVGAGTGSLLHLAGIPLIGELGGYALGPKFAEAVIPKYPEFVPVKPGEIGGQLPLAEEFYGQKGEALAKRGKEQAVLDKSFEQRLRDTEEARQKELADTEKFKEQHAEALMKRGKEQGIIDRIAARQQAAAPGIGRILTPSGEPARGAKITEGEPVKTGSEGRPATWTNEFVLREARKGNRAGITQAIERGLGLPENVRYVMGDPAYERAILNPREVTHFTPEGEPIRNKANPIEEARGQENIPTLARTPRTVIPKLEPVRPAIPFPGSEAVAVGEKPPFGKPPVKPGPTNIPEPVRPMTGPLENPKPFMEGVATEAPVKLSEIKLAGQKGRATPVEQTHGKIPKIGETPEAPATIEPVLRETGWEYQGRNKLGMHTIQEPGTNIKITLFDRELQPDFIRRKIAEKERQYGVPKKERKGGGSAPEIPF